MKKELYYIVTHKVAKCLLIADISKLGWMLFNYMKIETYKTERANRVWLTYNQDKINRECYGKNDGLSSKRGKENLEEKNILIYEEDEKGRRIKLNCDPSTWTVTPEQHEKIMKVLNNENLLYDEDQNDI